jgi:hypothetical protein
MFNEICHAVAKMQRAHSKQTEQNVTLKRRPEEIIYFGHIFC